MRKDSSDAQVWYVHCLCMRLGIPDKPIEDIDTAEKIGRVIQWLNLELKARKKPLTQERGR